MRNLLHVLIWFGLGIGVTELVAELMVRAHPPRLDLPGAQVAAGANRDRTLP